jgi:hypothetical protein
MPISVAPPPAPKPPPPELDDDRGALIPEGFDPAPGEPSGEYRAVRGAPQTSPSQRLTQPPVGRRSSAPETVLVTRVSPAAAPARKPVPMPSAYADRVPPRGSLPLLSIRVIGVAGFALGVALAAAFMIARGPVESFEPSPVALIANPPAAPAGVPLVPDAVAPKAEPESPHASREAAAPRALPLPTGKPAAAAPARITVSINATPWAIVSIDGREVGETPLAGIELAPGRHAFSARMADGTTREQLIDVNSAHAAVVFQ